MRDEIKILELYQDKDFFDKVFKNVSKEELKIKLYKNYMIQLELQSIISSIREICNRETIVCQDLISEGYKNGTKFVDIKYHLENYEDILNLLPKEMNK
jgi:hypothetical protein